MKAKIEAFRAKLEEQVKAQYIKDGFTDPVHEPHTRCTVKYGGKYARVDVGTSGRYMVVMDTGEIFGIKGYGVIHRGHAYGTVDTLDAFYWGGYKAHRLTQVAA